MSESSTGLAIQSLSWQPKDQERMILNDINGYFREGGFYGVLGPNGSGKTSLIRHILRLLETKIGKITLQDININQISRNELAKNLAFVPQNTNIDANFSVYDIVAMGRTPHQGRFAPLNKKDQEMIEEAMALTNCGYLRNQPFNYLSGGEAQRVLVARAIAQDTPWIILDEPISHLDIKHQVELMETLKQLNTKTNRTVIAILHDLNLTAAYCKDVLLMKDGNVFAMGEMEEVLTKENLLAVYEMEFDVIKPDGMSSPYFIPSMRMKE